MRDALILFIHLIVTLIRLAGSVSGGWLPRSLFIEHQLSILNHSRRRTPNLHGISISAITEGCFHLLGLLGAPQLDHTTAGVVETSYGPIGFTVNLSITKSTGWAVLGSCVMTTSLMFVSPGVAGRMTDNSDGLAAVTLRWVKSSFAMRAGLFEELGFAGLNVTVAKSKGCVER